MGRYVPPEHEGVLNPNQASRHAKPHPLGARARKLKTEGILTVRFEMPFPVWCGHCQPAHSQLIGQGVRFNAEKRKIGNYFSSPIFAFRMRHVVCGGWIEIHTDPKNTAYVVVSGGQRRKEAEGEEDGQAKLDDSLVNLNGAPPIITPAERDSQRESAFANLEKTIEDRAALEKAKERIDEIGEVSSRQWDDPYARNQALRRTFRVGRKAREREAAADEDIRERLGLGIDLLPENEEDARRAQLVDFGTAPEEEREKGEQKEEGKVLAKPLFGDDRKTKTTASTEEHISTGRGSSGKAPKRLKSEIAASKIKQSLVSEIFDNTRLASDPFLEPRSRDGVKSASTRIPGLKRKRDLAQAPGSSLAVQPTEKAAAVNSALVDYDSD